MEHNLKLSVKNINGSLVKDIILDANIFGVEYNQSRVQEVIRWQQNNQRAATYGTQSRGEVNYSNKKMRPQKRTGAARMGRKGAPHHRGGAVCFGPDGRIFNTNMPKREVRAVLKMVLSDKIKANQFFIIDNLNLPSAPKTKHIIEIMANLGLKNALFIDRQNNNILRKSVNNLENANFLAGEGINPLSLLKRKEIVLTLSELELLTAKLNSDIKQNKKKEIKNG